MKAYYKSCIENELARRCERNPRYSLRAFARGIGVSDGALSEILNGKRVPALKTAQKIIAGIGLSPEEGQKFLSSLATQHRARGLQRLNPLFKTLKVDVASRDLNADLFRAISEWYHVALLELTFVDGFKEDAQWIAQRLGISPIEAKLALNRLLELGLLERAHSGRVKKSDEQLKTTDRDLTTTAHKKLQKQLLENAAYALDNVPLELRSQTGISMAIDPEKLAEAKKLIQDFSSSLCLFLESGKRKKVYQLSVSLFPLEQGLDGANSAMTALDSDDEESV